MGHDEIVDETGPLAYHEIVDEIDELDYDEVVERVEAHVEVLHRGDKILGEALALMIWQIADNAGFAGHVLNEATNMVEAIEKKLQAELRQCIEEVVEGHIEFETGELKRRLDRGIEKQNRTIASNSREIDHLTEWRNRSERKSDD